MIRFTETLYGTYGGDCERFIFVRIPRRILGLSAWQKVRRIFPGVYARVGSAFVDNDEMFYKMDKRQLKAAIFLQGIARLEKKIAKRKERMAKRGKHVQ